MAARHLAQPPSQGTKTRVRAFDAVRGFSVVSMVLFHLCYDLRFLYGVPLGWFAPPLQDIWRASISWAFVFVAGCMYAWSRDNLRRACRYLAVAALVFVATTMAAVDVPISFGVIYCMGACTLTCWLLERLGARPRGAVPALALFAAFVLMLGLPRGHVGIGALSVTVPRVLYATPWLSWLGFPGPRFASGDYYPLLPFLLLYLAGSSMGRTWHVEGLPKALEPIRCAPLEAVGRLALPLYLAHQPLIIVVLEAFL